MTAGCSSLQPSQNIFLWIFFILCPPKKKKIIVGAIMCLVSLAKRNVIKIYPFCCTDICLFFNFNFFLF